MSDFKAKRHSVLEVLRQELSLGFLERTFELKGHKFVLRSPTEDDEVWADAFVRSNTPMAMLTSRKAPRLATSIKSIDGVGTVDLFPLPDDMQKEVKAELQKSPVQYRYWLYDQMLMFLSEESSRPFINDLFDAYEKMENDRNEALKKLPNS
jgi:hypothetical protein